MIIQDLTTVLSVASAVDSSEAVRQYIDNVISICKHDQFTAQKITAWKVHYYLRRESLKPQTKYQGIYADPVPFISGLGSTYHKHIIDRLFVLVCLGCRFDHLVKFDPAFDRSKAKLIHSTNKSKK